MRKNNSDLRASWDEKFFKFLLKIVTFRIPPNISNFEKRQRQFFNINVFIAVGISLFFILTNTVHNLIYDKLNFNDKALFLILFINILSLRLIHSQNIKIAFFFNFYVSLICISWIESKLIRETSLSTYTALIPFLIIYGRFAFDGFWEKISAFCVILACAILQSIKFIHLKLSFDAIVTMDLAEYFTILLIIDRVTVFYKRDFIHLNENLALISEQNEIIEQQSVKLRGLNEFKTTLFMLISKDVREPLAVLSKTFQTYRNSYKHNFASIIPNIQIILNEISLLLDNLLFWSKNEVYNLALRDESINLKDLIDSLLVSFEPQLRLKNAVFHTQLMETNIRSERQILTLILRNLIHKLAYSEIDFDCLFISIERSNDRFVLSGQLLKNNRILNGELHTKDEKITDLGFLVSKVFSDKLGFDFELYCSNLSCVSFTLNLPVNGK